MVVLHLDVYQGFDHIVTFLKGNVGLCHSLMVASHCDVHLHCLMLNYYIPFVDYVSFWFTIFVHG
jgi:hypothetical protein